MRVNVFFCLCQCACLELTSGCSLCQPAHPHQDNLTRANATLQQDAAARAAHVSALRARLQEVSSEAKYAKHELRRARRTVKTYEVMAEARAAAADSSSAAARPPGAAAADPAAAAGAAEPAAAGAGVAAVVAEVLQMVRRQQQEQPTSALLTGHQQAGGGGADAVASLAIRSVGA
jgi:hypothetical protein